MWPQLKRWDYVLQVFGSGYVSLYTASECLTVFSCQNKMPLKTCILLLSVGFVE